MLGADQAVVLLQHGGLDSLTGKTGLAMLRHRPGPIVAVIDPHHAGASLEAVTGIRRAVPVVADLQEALHFGPEVAVIGLAPSGGRLPQPVRADALAALRAGLSLASGLHSRLAADPEFAAIPLAPGQWIWDLRREPDGLQVAQARAASLPQRRVLALGTDMAVGKMSACLALQAAAEARGLPSGFVGTGQAGILISGSGVALDAVRVDYAAGAVEAAVLRAAERLPRDGVVLVEGQGSLCHPGSSASLPLLRGSQPTDLLLVHRAGQRTIERLPRVPLPPLPALVQLSEALAAIGRPVDAGPPPRVRALALNTARLEAAAAQRAIAEAQQELQLICADPLRGGAQILLEAMVEER